MTQEDKSTSAVVEFISLMMDINSIDAEMLLHFLAHLGLPADKADQAAALIEQIVIDIRCLESYMPGSKNTLDQA